MKKLVLSKVRWFIIGARNYYKIVLRYKKWFEILVKTRKKETITRVILRNGMQIESPKNHPILLTMVNETFFDKIHTNQDISIKQNDIVLDIGANVGIVTIFAALRTKKLVYAFEPSPENFSFLERNIAANGLQNIKAFNVAVSDKTLKSTRLYMNRSVSNSLLLEECPSNDYIDVPSMTLKDIIDEISSPEIGFLKMDCEGCEGLIFSSTPLEYLRKIREMDVEFHDASSSLKHDALKSLIEKSGFEVKLYWPFGKNSQYGAIHAKRK